MKLIVRSRSPLGSKTLRPFAINGDGVHTNKLEAHICEGKKLVMEMETSQCAAVPCKLSETNGALIVILGGSDYRDGDGV